MELCATCFHCDRVGFVVLTIFRQARVICSTQVRVRRCIWSSSGQLSSEGKDLFASQSTYFGGLRDIQDLLPREVSLTKCLPNSRTNQLLNAVLIVVVSPRRTKTTEWEFWKLWWRLHTALWEPIFETRRWHLFTEGSAGVFWFRTCEQPGPNNHKPG